MQIEVVPYTSTWVTTFEEEEARLRQIFPTIAIEHVGSTSVPGLAAKPIVDIMLGAPNEEALNALVEPLLADGLIYVKRHEDVMPFRRFFSRIKNREQLQRSPVVDFGDDLIPRTSFPRICHIHAVVKGTDFWTRHLLFRNHLRAHPEDRDAYGTLKMELAAQDWEDRTQYTQAKTSFIRSIEQKAGYEGSYTR